MEKGRSGEVGFVGRYIKDALSLTIVIPSQDGIQKSFQMPYLAIDFRI